MLIEIKIVERHVCGCEQYQDSVNGDKWWSYCWHHGRIQQQQYDEMSKRLGFAHTTIHELQYKLAHPEPK